MLAPLPGRRAWDRKHNMLYLHHYNLRVGGTLLGKLPVGTSCRLKHLLKYSGRVWAPLFLPPAHSLHRSPLLYIRIKGVVPSPRGSLEFTSYYSVAEGGRGTDNSFQQHASFYCQQALAEQDPRALFSPLDKLPCECEAGHIAWQFLPSNIICCLMEIKFARGHSGRPVCSAGV